MKVELKDIIDQLTEAIGLEEGYKVSALIDTENGDRLTGWTIVRLYDDGKIEPLENPTYFNSIKELIDAYKNE